MSDGSTTNVLIVGVGGQGILLASEVLSKAALLAGFDVKKSEVHGMSQRGGEVNSHVRFGHKVFSPLIPTGQAHFLVAMEKLEALRWSFYLAPAGIMIVNDFRLDPASVASGKTTYPEDAIQRLARSYNRRLVVIDGPEKSVQAGDLRTMNTVVLGALSRFVDLPEEYWLEGLKEHVRKDLIEVNRRAFDLGRQAVLYKPSD
ncbi:MAG TPA: indolepyruvate oxidoreductase subunit beta [archaeon]|nr:indolepyruvate oxidoreductase subunit beta [archaeon]